MHHFQSVFFIDLANKCEQQPPVECTSKETSKSQWKRAERIKWFSTEQSEQSKI